MINVVRRPQGILEPDQMLQSQEDILVAQGPLVHGRIRTQSGIELISAHWRQIIIIRVAEQVVKEAGRDLRRRRGTGTQSLVYLNLRRRSRPASLTTCSATRII